MARRIPDLTCFDVFARCVQAIDNRELVHRQSARDKEFHFQDWFESRLKNTDLKYECGGRNSYPDFRLVAYPEGYEIKGLAYPGRELNYDCNSQVCSGYHNGRTIYYVFGRYPKQPDGNQYPVLDLVLCHGDFLNADREYVHKNKSVKGFGIYGDIMIRDRKMYVAPTPFGLLEGAAHQRTLIVPADMTVTKGFIEVGRLIRRESDKLLVAYRFDLKANTLSPEWVDNPCKGKEHRFRVYRLRGDSEQPVQLRP